MSNAAAPTRWAEGLDGPAAYRAAEQSPTTTRFPLTRLLVVSDTLALLLGLLVSSTLASGMPAHSALGPRQLALLAATLPVWLAGACLSGLYRPDGLPAAHASAGGRGDLGQLVVVGTGAVLMVALATHIEQPAGAEVVVFGASAVGFAMAGRVAIRALARRSAGFSQTAVIVGAGEVGQLVARKLLRHPEYGVEVLGFVGAPPRRWRRDVRNIPVLGVFDDLASIVRDLAVDRVIVAFSRQNDQQTLALVRPLLGLNVRVDVVPRMFEMIGPGAGLLDVEGMPLVSVSPRARSALSSRLKRLIDVVGAILGLIAGAPLFLWAWWRIPRETPGPVLYRQTRLGANMREFTMLKFRTMTVDADQSPHHAYIERTMNGAHSADAGELYKLDRRDVVTPTGRWLRRTSLDELPQLINVLRGEMSLVGPRPCLDYETEYLAEHHHERFQVRPGITGLWQVTARAHASFAEALEMDVAYVRDWSLALDLALLLRTPAELLRQRRATV